MSFCRLYAIGRKFAVKFASAGCRKPEDLVKESEKAEHVRKFKLTSAQALGIKCKLIPCTQTSTLKLLPLDAKDIEQLIPRKESDKWKEVLLRSAKETDHALEGEILGSYRRGNAYSSGKVVNIL